MASSFAVRQTTITSMHNSCFFRVGSPRRRQALHSGGGGVTVVSRGGEGVVRAKIVVSRGELERIAAGVTRRLCSGGSAAPSRRHLVTAVSLEGQVVARAPPRSEPDEGARRGDDWSPALDGIHEEA